MKKLIAVCLLLMSSFAMADIIPEQTVSQSGVPLFRLFNDTDYHVACYYRDNLNYFTFTIAPYSYSMWYPSYGYFEWECR